jgi:hypothetical protein
MKRIFETTLIAAALMVFAIGSAEAGGRKKGAGMARGDRGDRGDRVARMARHLDLTSDQATALEKLRIELAAAKGDRVDRGKRRGGGGHKAAKGISKRGEGHGKGHGKGRGKGRGEGRGKANRLGEHQRAGYGR